MARFMSLCALAAALLIVPARSDAALFEATYTGEVGGGINSPLLLQSFPGGTPLSFTVTFDDDFITTDAVVMFGPPRPSTGSLNIGGVVYQLTSQQILVGSVDQINDEVIFATYGFTGTGPAVDGFEFLWLAVRMTPGLTLDTGQPFGSIEIVWDVDPGANLVLDGVMSNERTQQFSVEPLDVPTPPLALMILTGIGAAVARRVR